MSSRAKGGTPGRSRAVESAVTRLLVSIKALLEALTNWSLLKIDEIQVSDIYVRLGNDFNAAVAAFTAFNIDMAELLSVPEDLRNVLEQCLAEDATPENLDLYLPTVRQIITNLLQGLRGKQTLYGRIVRRSSEKSGHERTDSRSSRGEKTSRRAEGSHQTQGSRSRAENEKSEREDSSLRRSGHSSTKRKDDISAPIFYQTIEEQLVGNSNSSPQSSMRQIYNETSIFAFEDQPRHQSQSSAISGFNSTLSSQSQSFPLDRESFDNDSMLPIVSSVPANVKRYSLVDKPMPASPPTVVVEPDSPNIHFNESSPTNHCPPSEVPATVANSLAALKKSDVLERRASKRFSTFNISKMTGTSVSRERSIRNHPNRRSLAASSALTPGELAVLTEVDNEDLEDIDVVRCDGNLRSCLMTKTGNSDMAKETPLVPALPSSVTLQEPLSGTQDVERASYSSTQAYSSDERFTVFLQLGREVKKAVVDANLSFSSLRVLFVDKFSYNPGQDNFPAIYIRDPSSGVQYELEDTDEVKEKCLLSLNVEPLDQIKQHIDSQISSLSNAIKELKLAIAAGNRSPVLPRIATGPLSERTLVASRPSDHQFQHVAQRLSRFVTKSSSFPLVPQPVSFKSTASEHHEVVGQTIHSQFTGNSSLSEFSSRVVVDLKTQFDEVQNLRRDLGVMRQLFTEFMKQTKESLGVLRSQTQTVKQLANSNIGGARTFIDSGKKKLDTRSQTILTDVEKLLDTVENMKDDVTKRQVTPGEHVVKVIKKDIDLAAAELDSLKEHIKTIKPMWKKTWEEELQNIVEEQQFLTHQEEFLNDLLEDHKAAVEVYGHIEKVISLRGFGVDGRVRSLPRGRNFKSAFTDDASGDISHVMLEIRGAAVDPEKRLKAIEANQKIREKDLAGRSDELQAELTEFVWNKRLRMTGGAEEADRVRQKRSDATLRAMFNVQHTSASYPT